MRISASPWSPKGSLPHTHYIKVYVSSVTWASQCVLSILLQQQQNLFMAHAWLLCLQRRGRNLGTELENSLCTTCPNLLRSLCVRVWRAGEKMQAEWRTSRSGAVNSHWRYPPVTSENILDVKHLISSGVHNKWTSQRGIYLTGRYNHKQFFFTVIGSLSLAFITVSLEQLDPGNSIKYKMKAWGTGSNANWNSVMFKVISFVCF